MSRNDISEYVIHFTKGENLEDAFSRLKKIISDGFLFGSNGMIKGQYNCVCFSEAPIGSLNDGLVNPEYYSSYSPFGILLSKKHLFELGGRPVIYQSDSEFNALPESHRWRHVRYEPPEIDFSWEREWRIQCDAYKFDSMNASIVVQDGDWANRLINDHDLEQEYEVQQYSLVMSSIIAEMYRTSFQWKILTLRS